MGFYNTGQSACAWGSSSGMVGAGYHTSGGCGTYPTSLKFGTCQGNPYMGSLFSGTVKIWIWMDNKQPIT